MVRIKYDSIRIHKTTKDTLDKLEIWLQWVGIKTYDDKIKHLLWFYENNKQ